MKPYWQKPLTLGWGVGVATALVTPVLVFIHILFLNTPYHHSDAIHNIFKVPTSKPFLIPLLNPFPQITLLFMHCHIFCLFMQSCCVAPLTNIHVLADWEKRYLLLHKLLRSLRPSGGGTLSLQEAKSTEAQGRPLSVVATQSP